MTITKNADRVGNFTSSEIADLMTEGKVKGTWGKTALTYISEKNMERKLGRSIGNETNARSCSWGKVVENRCFDLLGTEYRLSSQETFSHPEITFWSGSPDGNKFDEGKTVIDIKCPMTLKSFCQLVDPLYEGLTGTDCINAVRNGYRDKNGQDHDKHKDGDKYYWQLVSNAIITDSKFAELIIYVPYFHELEAIRDIVRTDKSERNIGAWINFVDESELPYLIEGGYYKNINVIRFEIPIEDKLLLTAKVQTAGKLLSK
jgi:hypothetical protein